MDRIRKGFALSRECYHGGRFREASSEGREILDFSASINPLGPPPLEDLVLRELENIGHYPDNRYRQFKHAAARFVGVEPENIVPGNGSSELIRLFAEMTLEEGAKAVVPSPTFGEYETQSRLFGAEIERVKMDPEGRPTFGDLGEARAAFLCNPNNPTGILLPGREVESLARRCESSETFLLVDEAFIELSDPRESVARLAPEMEYLFVMRSLTKSFGVPGLRLGFGVASPAFAKIMDRARIPWSIGSVAAAAGAFLLEQDGHLEISRALIRRELAWLAEALKGLGLRPLESSANFILVDVKPSGLSSDEMAKRMEAKGALVRDCRSFGLDGYIRVAVRTRRENERLVSALENVI
jgi:threonine-phosphate decarboxylase